MRKNIYRFKELSFFHILKSLNKEVDLDANLAVHLKLGELRNHRLQVSWKFGRVIESGLGLPPYDGRREQSTNDSVMESSGILLLSVGAFGDMLKSQTRYFNVICLHDGSTLESEWSQIQLIWGRLFSMKERQTSLPQGLNPSYPFMARSINEFEALLIQLKRIDEICWTLVDGYVVEGIVQAPSGFPRWQSFPSKLASSIVIWLVNTMDYSNDNHIFRQAQGLARLTRKLETLSNNIHEQKQCSCWLCCSCSWFGAIGS